jgi:ribosomal protein S18 acetylase RimI-like enzyme
VTLRPASLDDFDAIAELFRAGVEMYEELEFEPDELRRWLTAPTVDLERDIRLSFDGERLLGYVDIDPTGENPVRWWSDVRVHPDADFARIVPELLGWAESRAVGGLLRTWAPRALVRLRTEFERAGMRRVRGSWRMEIDIDDTVPAPQFADGLVVRAMEPGQEHAVYDAHQESFADSWEHQHEPYEEWRHWLVDAEAYDPSLWFLAWDGAQLAGVSLCRVRNDVGWIGILGVRRPWRRRGLGRALLLHSFHELRRRGLTRAGLGVDAESLTGAHKLYESAGMHVVRELGFFEKSVPA